jgi:hypothetical protein
VKEFVRRGQTEGSTEIWLATGEERQVVKVYRKIRTDNKSEWKINSKSPPSASTPATAEQRFDAWNCGHALAESQEFSES